MIPNRRFREEPMTAREAIAWFKTHRYVWYHAPMDRGPVKLDCVSVLKLWARSPERFAVSTRHYSQFGNESIRIDNGHLDRLRVPYSEWHHGIKATVTHVRYQGDPKRRIVLHQSNGFHLQFERLAYAITFARRQSMELSVNWGFGRKKRILVPAVQPISGEMEFPK